MSKKNFLKGFLLINTLISVFLGIKNSIKGYKDFIPFSSYEGKTFYGKKAFCKTINIYIYTIFMLIFLPIIALCDFIYDLKHPEYRNKRRT